MDFSFDKELRKIFSFFNILERWTWQEKFHQFLSISISRLNWKDLFTWKNKTRVPKKWHDFCTTVSQVIFGGRTQSCCRSRRCRCSRERRQRHLADQAGDYGYYDIDINNHDEYKNDDDMIFKNIFGFMIFSLHLPGFDPLKHVFCRVVIVLCFLVCVVEPGFTWGRWSSRWWWWWFSLTCILGHPWGQERARLWMSNLLPEIISLSSTATSSSSNLFEEEQPPPFPTRPPSSARLPPCRRRCSAFSWTSCG